MKGHTIKSAIVEVLKRNPNGLTPTEITEKIKDLNLYQFSAKDPKSVVNQTIRKACVGVIIKNGKSEKIFVSTNTGRYKLQIQ